MTMRPQCSSNRMGHTQISLQVGCIHLYLLTASFSKEDILLPGAIPQLLSSSGDSYDVQLMMSSPQGGMEGTVCMHVC